ncbi:putative PKS/NRPS-like protein biosynthetic cluster [Aspergillus pseudoviridinutans]|uniref:PKS/NRPS-like protein biosynthetic cluster n=1 Tax=Aspergillus pseudoviridinutans TaxID=1517512 RepID=A0A9P3ET21_9EURO|nr:putative PKS/NRPS-like protein biosynthetic cluster [Aspergillus pseudoviridinutans]GIJ86874.1 putative PKS/NRPS-like protein biosynthetic cluster [Aspergillus pseudoviridinutans]
MASRKVWLITGASSGLGAALSIDVLKAGHSVVALARNPDKARKSYPEVEELGGNWAQVDVTDANTTKVFESLIKQHGGVDVVVNNAGYSILGSIEDMAEEEFHQQINTNLYGPIRVLKGVLPSMRAQCSGTIVNISSVAGMMGRASTGLYSASKFALEGLSESLAAELVDFNIRVLIVQPGGFRTGFLSAYVQPKAGMNPAYANTAMSKALDRYSTINGTQKGDPKKAARRIFEAVEIDGLGANSSPYLRIALGSDCYQALQWKTDALKENLDVMSDIAHSTDYD